VATEERNAWARLGVGILTLLGYVTALVLRADGGPVSEVAYQPLLLGAIGLAVIVSIVVTIVLGLALGDGWSTPDERDRAIQHLGTRVGQAFLVIGGLAAMAMAMATWDHFWIANTLALGFWASGVLECVAKVAAYRWGVPTW
jgi:hypothetical protein